MRHAIHERAADAPTAIPVVLRRRTHAEKRTHLHQTTVPTLTSGERVNGLVAYDLWHEAATSATFSP